jgi:hypothetical protein
MHIARHTFLIQSAASTRLTAEVNRHHELCGTVDHHRLIRRATTAKYHLSVQPVMRPSTRPWVGRATVLTNPSNERDRLIQEQDLEDMPASKRLNYRSGRPSRLDSATDFYLRRQRC